MAYTPLYIYMCVYETVFLYYIKPKTFCTAKESDATENEHVRRIHFAFFGVLNAIFFISSDSFFFIRVHRDL